MAPRTSSRVTYNQNFAEFLKRASEFLIYIKKL